MPTCRAGTTHHAPAVLPDRPRLPAPRQRVQGPTTSACSTRPHLPSRWHKRASSSKWAITFLLIYVFHPPPERRSATALAAITTERTFPASLAKHRHEEHPSLALFV